MSAQARRVDFGDQFNNRTTQRGGDGIFWVPPFFVLTITGQGATLASPFPNGLNQSIGNSRGQLTNVGDATQLYPRHPSERSTVLVAGGRQGMELGMKRRTTERQFSGNLAQWRGDCLGGTVAALIAIPYSVALSIAMGLPPEAGLYTTIVGGLISGMLSRAPIVISGLSATVVPVLAALVKVHGIEAALTAGAISGLIMTLIGVMRWGRFFSYLPVAVIGAFTSGLGVIIVVSQMRQVFGMSQKPASIGFNLGVVDDLLAVLLHLESSQWGVFLIGLIVIVTMFVWPRAAPKLERYLPASLVAVFLATFAADLSGIEIERIGTLPASFVAPSLGSIDLTHFSDLIHPALTLAGLITINQLLTIVVTDRLAPDGNEVRFNRELVAQGVANTVCPFFGAPPGVAMLARTIASKKAGAVSRWSVIAHSLVLVIFLLPLRDLIGRIPLVVLAGVTVTVGLQLIGVERFRELRRGSKLDAALFLLTFGLVVVTDLIVGVGVGMLIAMLHFVERSAKSSQIEKIEPPPAPLLAALSPVGACHGSGVGAYRVTGPLFFGSSERIFTQLLKERFTADLVLDLARAGPIDSGALSFFRRLGERQRTMGGRLHLTGLDPSIADEIERSGLAPEIVWLIRHHQVETAGTAGVVFGGEPLPGPLLHLNPSSTGGSSR
ncbi:MAG: SulP family inorganic anion transporter [Blastocatellia bacterium]